MTTERALHREAFFLPTPSGDRFALATYPKGDPKGGWLYVHPFAEEMNKSRRMAALAARAFAQDGWCVLQIDLAGCGDSQGDFGDATWQNWLDDLSHAWHWLERRCEAPKGLWTLRAGSLLAADWLQQHAARPPLLLWQPVIKGRQHLAQFLRLKAANSMLGASEMHGVTNQLREQLKSSRPVEVAGYSISPALAAGLENASLRLPQPYTSPIALFETGSGERTGLSPGNATLVEEWRGAHMQVSSELIPGCGFWQTLEIETAPRLIAASRQALTRLAT